MVRYREAGTLTTLRLEKHSSAGMGALFKGDRTFPEMLPEPRTGESPWRVAIRKWKVQMVKHRAMPKDDVVVWTEMAMSWADYNQLLKDW